MPSSLLASCRALQNILGSAPALSCQNARHSSTIRRRTEPARNALSPTAHTARVRKSLPLKPIAPRGLKKRRREEYEDEAEHEQAKSPLLDQENRGSSFQTPKRQRRIPLAMPLGLSAADFQSLSPQTGGDVELDMPDPPPFEVSNENESESRPDGDWTVADDRALVETVLEKLRLSKHEWNDCARILGKDKDSLGRRWKMLVGDGDVGLRRGGKRLGRTDLDIKSW